MKISREFSMPNGKTFTVPAIKRFVERWVKGATVIVDPFARDSRYGTITNDLNPETSADYHMEAGDFCRLLCSKGITADVVLFDPPYSPRQISEVYQSVGLKVGIKETQNAALYKRVRDGFDPIVPIGGVVLSFGWHSNGMGKKRGYEIEEILLVAHGGAHNDTICIAERKVQSDLFDPEIEAVL